MVLYNKRYKNHALNKSDKFYKISFTRQHNFFDKL